MSEGMNKVILLGNMGQDPELRFTKAGDPVLNLRIATTERYKEASGEWKERTDWHSVVVWGKRGESLARILQKGSSVLIEGSLRTSSYDDRDGKKQYRTEVNAQNVILAGGKGAPVDRGEAVEHSRTQHGAPRREERVAREDDDIPF
jgi:single-strand DNA-binding protein